MNYARLVPDRDEFVRLPLDGFRALLRRRFGRAPHFERLNQRKMMVLAQRMQTRMAFHAKTSAGDQFRRPEIPQRIKTALSPPPLGPTKLPVQTSTLYS